MLAYTRYVLDAGTRGDPLALKVALAPCVIGYAEIAMRFASRPDADAATNPYRVWIAECAGVPYQEVAEKARAHLEHLADLYATPAREAELIAIFKEATRLEADLVCVPNKTLSRIASASSVDITHDRQSSPN